MINITTKRKAILINIVIAILFFLIQYNNIVSIKIHSAMPMLTLALAISVSMFLSEVSATMTGLIIGIISDTSASTPFGFNAILFTVICFSVSLIVHYLFNNNIRSCMVLELFFTVLYFFVSWLFFYSSGNADEHFTYLFKIGVPSAVYTSVLSGIIYLIEKKLLKSLSLNQR